MYVRRPSRVGLIDATIMSEGPPMPSPPAAEGSHRSICALTPSRAAISSATSTSKPIHDALAASYQDRGSSPHLVATVIDPDLQTRASASVPVGSTEAHRPVLPDTGVEHPAARKPMRTTVTRHR